MVTKRKPQKGLFKKLLEDKGGFTHETILSNKFHEIFSKKIISTTGMYFLVCILSLKNHL